MVIREYVKQVHLFLFFPFLLSLRTYLVNYFCIVDLAFDYKNKITGFYIDGATGQFVTVSIGDNLKSLH